MCVFLATWHCLAAASNDVGSAVARELREAGVIVPLEHILREAREQHGGRVLETEVYRKGARYMYEIEILGDDGVVREMKFDATTGAPWHSDEDD
jgi:uncharacterized membrane protein YkoI